MGISALQQIDTDQELKLQQSDSTFGSQTESLLIKYTQLSYNKSLLLTKSSSSLVRIDRKQVSQKIITKSSLIGKSYQQLGAYINESDDQILDIPYWIDQPL